MASPGFLSKRVKKVSQSGLTSDRYEYLGLNQAEPDLGDPLIGISSVGAKPKPISGDVYVLAAYSSQSNNGINSNRYWVSSIDLTSGLSLTPGSFTVFNNGAQVGLANSFNKFNFVGSGVTVSAVGTGVSEQTGIATITISVTDAVAKGEFKAVQYHGAGGLIQGAGDFVFDPNTSNIGIGSTQPQHKLDIIGNVNINGISTFNSDIRVVGLATFAGITTSTSFLFANNLGVAGVSTFNGLVEINNGLTANSATIENLTTTGVSTFNDTSKFVGIATFNNDVYVSSGSTIYITNFADRFGSTGSTGLRLIRDSVGIAWTTSSDVSAGGTFGNIQYHSASGLINGDNGFNYDFINQRVGVGTTVPTQSLQVGAGITDIFVVSQTGSTGIGTTVPQAKLHVFGDSILTRVGVAITSVNTNLELGKTYMYYSSVTLTLPPSPTSGDRIEIINRSNTTTAVLARNGSNIMGLAEDLELDIIDGAFTVTYSNINDGWVIGR